MLGYHQQILDQIKQHATTDPKHNWVSKYLGTPHLRYGLKTDQLRSLSKAFYHQNLLAQDQFIDLLNQLFSGQSFEERAFADYLIFRSSEFRQTINPQLLNDWLDHLEGWAEVDTLCQSNFTAKDLLAQWPKWSKLIAAFNHSQNISKRRASLVLLTKPVGQSTDPRLSDLAFQNIDHLKHHQDILITKAISWLLRALITNHRQPVEDYLAANSDSLPKIALRETTVKLLTGKKTHPQPLK